MNKITWIITRIFMPLAFLVGGGYFLLTNNIQTNYMLIADNNGNVPTNVAACNVPLNSLQESTKNVIKSNPSGVCLGGLTIAGGPPILGDANENTIIMPWNKYNADIQAAVVGDTLICQVPCSNADADEIEKCYDFSSRGYSINAFNGC